MPTKKHPTIAIDLSALPKELQEVVGDDLTRSVLSRVGPIRGPVVVGKLRPGIYGMIVPELLDSQAIKDVQAVIDRASLPQ